MLYLVSYDVQDDNQRNQAMKYLKDCGYHLQKSVFMVDCHHLPAAREIYQTIQGLANSEDDKLLMVPLCQQCFGKRMLYGNYPLLAQSTWIF